MSSVKSAMKIFSRSAPRAARPAAIRCTGPPSSDCTRPCAGEHHHRVEWLPRMPVHAKIAYERELADARSVAAESRSGDGCAGTDPRGLARSQFRSGPRQHRAKLRLAGHRMRKRIRGQRAGRERQGEQHPRDRVGSFAQSHPAASGARCLNRRESSAGSRQSIPNKSRTCMPVMKRLSFTRLKCETPSRG